MLEVQAVAKQFISGRGHVAALTGISFTVASGRGTILAGRSGSGKTTLLNCLGALEVPDSGAIVVAGANICAFSARQRTLFRRQKVGFVFQAGNLLPWLTVAENLRFPLELNNIQGKRQAVRITELLESFGLAGYERALPAELSGGEAQRIAFARAIAHSPALLLADEPTASLDSANGRQLMGQMFALCRNKGTTLVIASHDREIMNMTEHIIYLKDGRLEEKPWVNIV